MAKLPGEGAGVGKVNRVPSSSGGASRSSSGASPKADAPRFVTNGVKRTVSNTRIPGGDDDTVGDSVGVGRRPTVGQVVTGIQTGSAAAGAGVTAYIFGKLGSFVSSILASLLATAQGALANIMGFFGGIFSALSGIMGAAGALATMVGSGIMTLILAGAVFLGIISGDEQQRVGAIVDCGTGITAIEVDGAQQGDMNSNAKKVYDALSAYGMDDMRIAGCLGNLQAESSIDPTCIEGFYGDGDHYAMNEEKAAAAANMNEYCVNTLFPLYDRNGTSYVKDGYKVASGEYACGGGMAQYTAEGFYDLVKSAEAASQEWYSLNFAIAYLINGNHRGGAKFWDDWKAAQTPVNPAEAATYFSHNYEGNTVNAQSERCTFANEWYARMPMWDADASYGNSILDLASTLSDVALDATVASKLEKCKKMMTYDNSSIAAAVVSFAWPTQDQGVGNNGTDLYQRVHDNAIGKDDPYYMSCDRTICAAIRWSGSDDDFPAGNSDMQVNYMNDSPKWEFLGTSADVRVDQLLPGDVFGLYGHVFLYTGHELIAEKHGNAAADNADSVSGSYMERSPGCGNDASDVIDRMGGQDWIGRGVYQIFRCVNPDNSDKYKDAGSANASV